MTGSEKENFDEVYSRQRQLENEKGIEKKIKYDELRKKVSVMKPEEQLISDLAESLTEEIEKNRKERSPKGRPPKFRKLLLDIPISSEKIALITLYQSLKACISIDMGDDGANKLTTIACQIADGIILEISSQLLLKEIPGNMPSWKALYIAKKKVGSSIPRWTPELKVQLGAKLIDLLTDSTKAFQLYKTCLNDKTTWRLKLSDNKKKLLHKKHIRYEKLIPPSYEPMICPPVPWEDVKGGGYLLTKTSLINRLSKKHKEQLEKADLRNVYKALNIVQSTPWRINPKIYEVIKECQSKDLHLTTLHKEDLKPPKKPAGYKTNKVQKDEYFRKKRRIKTLKTKREQINRIIEIADNYKKEQKIYFPHYMDWRGRVYPFPENLNPQGNDIARALLEFADGKPIGEKGAFWLAIHIANLFGIDGIDKCSFEDRFKWLVNIQDKIIDSVLNPFNGEMFWSKADKPWCALAACFEWYGYCQEGMKWISHIPVVMDGTCNGLQHYSAMGKDLKGAEATNLINSEKPQDIYSEVLNVVRKSVQNDIKRNKKEAKNWQNCLDRKIVKRAVMTTPYGVKKYGIKRQLYDIIEEKDIIIPGSLKDNIEYLSKHLQKAIGDVVESAYLYMQWFRNIAEVLAEKNIPIVWTTPIGFIVYQGHKKCIGKKEVRIGGNKRLIFKKYAPNILNKNKQKQGLPPNFIHSMDAAHMMMTVISAYEKHKISSFAMVHDSYGVHACDWENFSPLIRREFFNIYSKDILMEFKNELQSCICDFGLQIPLPPETGELDISKVLEAKYFFS